MKRVKEKLDQYYTEYRDASWQKLDNNAARFKKESEVINLILMSRRNEIQEEEARHDENLPEENHEVRNDISNNNNYWQRMMKNLKGWSRSKLKLGTTAPYYS